MHDGLTLTVGLDARKIRNLQGEFGSQMGMGSGNAYVGLQ